MIYLSINRVTTSGCLRLFLALVAGVAFADAVALRAQEAMLEVGVAQVDITPAYPVRLSGFGFRRTESEGVTHKIWAKALAIADGKEGPALLITVDNLCVPDEITQTIALRLAGKAGVKRERLAITATHTHTAPMLRDVAPTLFGTNIPPAHQANIDRYTREFTDKLEQVALDAVKGIQRAKLSWGMGTVDFAINRRTKGGPVDHDLPVLVVHDPHDHVRAVYFSYACHCVTLSDNRVSGDWAGFAQSTVERLFPGAVALASVGCGADSNPSTRGSGTNYTAAVQQGDQVAHEIQRLLATRLTPITVGPRVRYDRVVLSFDAPRTQAEWEERARSSDYAVAYHARVNLERLAKGESLPTAMNYPIQTWVFGDALAMVFLPGETVVDYALRLKREFDRTRLWVNGYANEGRCYIPSERILKEGGYEGGHAMIYYDRPHRFAPGLEQKIIDVVSAQVPAAFAAPKGTEGIPPQPPQKSLRSIRTRPGLAVELIAAEPLIRDPVAIDWGRDGKLWVCEMHDYPAGTDQNWLPGGTVKLLTDTNGDGVYDQATLFAQGLPFPTGITAWGKGLFICAAPDIIYAEDTDGDGRADRLDKVFSGFATDNFQARVNSLSLGLDNWIYGANGLLGGVIRLGPGKFPAISRGLPRSPVAEFNLRNRDFRISPFTGEFDLASGLTQQGRVRDDWGNWFGCDNSQLLLYYPLAESYLRRNPHIPTGPPAINLTARAEGNRVFPASRLQERYNDLDQANRATSACGLGIYRDTLLGAEYYGNAFTAEPVHNLVHREVLNTEKGAVKSRRALEEKDTEFFASSDNWCRPVQVRTGPDGALYVVDMYRFLVEHPRWIPAARLAQLDVRAGSDLGRIYRVRPVGVPLRLIRDLSRLRTAELARALDSPNGTDRDRVHIELLLRQDQTATATLEKLALDARLPQVRLQALSVLEGLRGLTPRLVERSLADPDEHVRQGAVRLAEPWLRADPTSARASRQLAMRLVALTNDLSPGVLRQLALTLGEWPDARSGRALATLAMRDPAEPALRLAALSSASRHGTELLAAVARLPESTPGRTEWLEPLLATAAGTGNDRMFSLALPWLITRGADGPPASGFGPLASWLAALERRGLDSGEFFARHPELRDFSARLAEVYEQARKVASDSGAPNAVRETALRIVGRPSPDSRDTDLLLELATQSGASNLSAVAIAGLRRNPADDVGRRLVEQWPRLLPGTRTHVGALLMERPEWTLAWLQALETGKVQTAEVSLSDRQRLRQSSHAGVRAAAARLFPAEPQRSATELYERYRTALSTTGNPTKGAEVFAQNCAACHELNGSGYDVGPRLALLRDKDPDYWLKNILEPNAVVEPKFVSYQLELKDERSLTGLIKGESANSLLLVMANGVQETLLRSHIKEIRAATLSLMPEGMDQAISPAAMVDLIAYVKANASPSPSPAPATVSAEAVLRDPASVARFILDPNQPSALREATVKSNPQFAADLIGEMTRDLLPGTPAEYVRIPWLWRVAIAAGKRNDTLQVRRILARSLPEPAEPLRDWQAVVVGGGLINGLSGRGDWPRARIQEILATDSALAKRWAWALEQAAAMADNPKTPSGTRYDALRMLGAGPWKNGGSQLARYLGNENVELQMGAVSGLADLDAPEAAQALVDGYERLAESNRRVAMDAFLRNETRLAAMLEAATAHKIVPRPLTDAQLQQLERVRDERLKARVRALFPAKAK